MANKLAKTGELAEEEAVVISAGAWIGPRDWLPDETPGQRSKRLADISIEGLKNRPRPEDRPLMKNTCRPVIMEGIRNPVDLCYYMHRAIVIDLGGLDQSPFEKHGLNACRAVLEFQTQTGLWPYGRYRKHNEFALTDKDYKNLATLAINKWCGH